MKNQLITALCYPNFTIMLLNVVNKSNVCSSVVQEHMNRHTGTPSYICKLCNRGFFAVQTLQNHIAWNHSSERLHCEICSFRTATKGRLQEHMR